MGKLSEKLSFQDDATFQQNLEEFSAYLPKLNSAYAPILSAALSDLVEDVQDKSTLLNAMLELDDTAPSVTSDKSEQGTLSEKPEREFLKENRQKHWFIEKIEIEGLRGINNEGTPLSIKFKRDCVSSISAPNGTGKSSIYDALSFAIRGGIEKLDELPQAEKSKEYYVNRFHPQGKGTISLTLAPDDGGKSVTVIVSCDSKGNRTVSGPAGFDVNGFLKEMDREFVLLDGETFRSFIEDKSLERGRSFAGLLGLTKYSVLRQQLQSLSNTRFFNNYFEVAVYAAKASAANRAVEQAKSAIASDYKILTNKEFELSSSVQAMQASSHAALAEISMLKEHCLNKPFLEIDLNACLETVRLAEGGKKIERLVAVIREEAKWNSANKALPSHDDLSKFVSLAALREEALRLTSGDLLHQLFKISEKIISSDMWESESLCPTCGKDDGASVLAVIREKLGQYDALEVATAALSAEWDSKGWTDLLELESLVVTGEDVPHLQKIVRTGAIGLISSEQAKNVVDHIVRLRLHARDRISALALERAEIEKSIPASLVAVTTSVEAARRLQKGWTDLLSSENELLFATNRNQKVIRIKRFLDDSSSSFAAAESDLNLSRLKNIEPIFQDIFSKIMFAPVVPSLKKARGSEELSIGLTKFWEITDVSAQALLSESYRNAFAISVYLAAASLYGGTPRFVILDDITSSFDAGNQHHLVEVIRTRFARPQQVSGPQVIFLSHDTLLEKLFNKLSSSPEWMHHRLEGTARTAVLLQSGAVNKVREKTIELLESGRVEDAAPRIRQYLEYTLHNIVDKCRIPVPIDLAFGDDKRTAGEYLGAIESAVKLHKSANTLVMDESQVKSMQLHSTAIVSNFLSHWSTGQTQAFSWNFLLGVMKAIDDFPDCFKYETSPGAQKKFYSSLSKK